MKRKGIKSLLAMLLVAVLLTSFSVPAFACHDSKPSTANYTVYYREYGSNIQLAPSVSKSATVGQTVTETAIPISGYTVYGQSTKSLYISNSKCNSITFYYQKQQVQTADYTVRYLEYGTEAVLAPEKHVADQTVGSIVTETAIDIDGYRLVGSETQTLEIKACTSGGSGLGGEAGNPTSGPVTKEEALQIALAHAGLSESSVKDIEIEKEREHGVYRYEVEFECRHGYEYEYDIECSTGKILSYEWEHNGCSKCGNGTPSHGSGCSGGHKPCPDTDDEVCNVITFYYEKIALADYTVKYLDIDTHEPVADEKVQAGLEVGTAVTENAIDVDGYTAVEPTEITIELTENGNEIIFYYEKQPVLTSYEVRYLEAGTDTELATPKTVMDQPVGSEVTEDAITIEGYDILGDSSQSLVLEENGNVIIFYYEKQPVLTSYEVRYLEAGTDTELAPSKTVTDQPVGSEVTEDAITIEGYDLLGDSSQNLVLEENGNVIVFYYEKQIVLTSYTIHYVDVDYELEIVAPKTVTDIPVGDVITEYAIEIGGYTALAPEITFTLQESGNDYTIYYRWNTID